LKRKWRKNAKWIKEKDEDMMDLQDLKKAVRDRAYDRT